MKRFTYLSTSSAMITAALGLSACSVLSAQGVDGYTSIEFDQSSATVYAYGETDLDYSAASYYQPCVFTSLSVVR